MYLLRSHFLLNALTGVAVLGALISPTQAAQHTVTDLLPSVISDVSDGVVLTVEGSSLDGNVTAVTLCQGSVSTFTCSSPTFQLDATTINPIGPGFTELEATFDFDTASAPYGLYSLFVQRTGSPTVTIPLLNSFFIRNPAQPLVANGDFETGDLTGWTLWEASWGGINTIEASSSGGGSFTPPSGTVFDGTYSLVEHETFQSQGGDAGVLQTIPVLAEERLNLSWAWAGGDCTGVNDCQPVPSTIHQIGVAAGAHASAHDLIPDLGFDEFVNFFGTKDWAERGFQIIVPPGVDRITVFTRTWHLPGQSRNISTFWDNIVLTSIDSCPNPQHTTTSVGSPTPDAELDLALTVFGTNLTEVTAAKLLIDGTTTQYFASSITPAVDGLSMTVNFTAPAGGFTLGSYDLITDQTECATQILPDAVTFECPATPTVTGLSMASAVKPLTTLQMTVTGTDLDRLQSISLKNEPPRRDEFDPPLGVRGTGPWWDQTNLPGVRHRCDVGPFWLLNTFDILDQFVAEGTIIDDSNPSAILVEFDFTNAQSGAYSLIATRDSVCDAAAPFCDPDVGDNPCGCDIPYDAVVLEDAFTLELPDGDNMVQNPGFESGDSNWTLTTDAQCQLLPGTNPPTEPELFECFGPQIVDKSNIGVTLFHADFVTGNDNYLADPGGFFAGIASSSAELEVDENGTPKFVKQTPNVGTIEQSLGLPFGAGEYNIVLRYHVSLWDTLGDDNDGTGPEPTDARVTAGFIVDGAEVSSTTVRILNNNLTTVDGCCGGGGYDPYTPVEVDFIGTANTDITIRFEVSTNSKTSPNKSLVAIDNVSVISSISCPDPFADADEDGDVDEGDFAALQRCITGPDFGGSLSDECRCFDVNLDGDVEQTDITAFIDCVSGPSVPADTDCAP